MDKIQLEAEVEKVANRGRSGEVIMYFRLTSSI